MQKIILYYKFVPLSDPVMVMRWQRELCLRLNLRGRIIIAPHGINGTLGGRLEDVKAYVRAMNQVPETKGITYKWSDGSGDDFPKLSVKVRKELVTLAPDEQFDVYDSGTALNPAEWQAYLRDHPDAVVLDARNEYESAIGAFRGARLPAIKTFKDIKPELEHLPKDQPVLTYCTGDVRCEYLSAYMKHKGFQTVYHLDGGIVTYGQAFKADDLWQGRCYVFDKRQSIGFDQSATVEGQVIGRCARCQAPAERLINCVKADCNRQVVLCGTCQQAAEVCARHKS